MFWLLSAMILYGFAILLIGLLLAARNSNPALSHLLAVGRHPLAAMARHLP